jgi:redox-sensitive bicupin YhaK (pirin superfamily)
MLHRKSIGRRQPRSIFLWAQKESAMLKSALAPSAAAVARTATHRHIALRTRGRTHGPITRLMSPGDIGEHVKPFVFLDYFEADGFPGRGFPAHPHSGIATHTTLIQGSFDYGDSTGKSGTLQAGSVEWMQAGGGVWHWGAPHPNEPVRGYQLWIALPQALEHEPAESHYIKRPRTEEGGQVRVLLGTYGTVQSPLPYREPVTYLYVTLKDGERWTFEPNAGHEVAWLAVNKGALRTDGARLEREMVVFEEGEEPIEIEAVAPTEFVIASARKHPHPLVCGYYSVHSSPASLARGERRIDVIGESALVRDAIRRTAR